MIADLKLVNGRVEVRTRYAPAVVERLRAIPGRQAHFVKGAEGEKDKFSHWSVPAAPDALSMVCDVLGVLPQYLPGELRSLCSRAGTAARPPADLSLIEGHKFLTEPYQHQKIGLAELLQHDRWLLAWEMGCGKTFVVANRLKTIGTSVCALVLCPKSVISVWEQQLLEHGGLGCQPILGDHASRRLAIHQKTYLVKVANYELLQHSWGDFFAAHWDVLVLDEVQRCKSFTSQTCRLVRQLSQRAKYVWALSGTPAPNGLEDWLGVVECVRPKSFPCVGAKGDVTKTAFEARYTVKDRLGEGGPYVISGYRNVAELHGIVQSISSRVTKTECLDLPLKSYSTRRVRLEGEQARVYRDLKNHAVAHLRALKKEGTLTINNVLTESLRLLQVVGGFVPDDDGAVYQLPEKAKEAALKEVVEEVGDKQVVVWCAFKAEVQYLTFSLPIWFGGTALAFTGDTPAGERQGAVELFKSGDARFFVGTAGAGGLGINGLQVADTEVYYSRNWNLADYLQSQDRLHRIGQKSAVSVVKLVADGTVDVAVEEALERKDALQKMLLEDPEGWL